VKRPQLDRAAGGLEVRAGLIGPGGPFEIVRETVDGVDTLRGRLGVGRL